MNCEKMFGIMPMLLNGTLAKDEEKAAFEHLMNCEECRRELAFWTKIADSRPEYEKEFTSSDRKKIYEGLTRKKPTTLGLTKQAVKVYFKVIEQILNV